MKLHDSVNNGLVQELNRLCGTTVNTYSFKDKVSDLNNSLDWYFSLAETSANNWTLDDSNQTSPPIDTVNLVSGTNRYKLSAFTEEIVELLRLEALDSDANGLVLIPETLDSFGNVGGSGQLNETVGTFEEVYLQAPSGVPTHYVKYGDFIYLRPNPDYSETSGLKAYFNRPASKFTFVAVTAATDNILTTTSAHNLALNDTVIFETDGTIPTGLTADTQYYVISGSLDTLTFKVSATLGGTEIDITNAQTSSNHCFLKTNKEPGIVSTHHQILARKASANFMEFNNTGGVYNSRLQTILPHLQKDERDIEAFYARRDKDVKQRLTPVYQDNE